ncbi:hypothetical protein [Rhodovulum sulfidophilum]|uniref:hypothetical protein n=1 Tax=Rhodovulum sulfidophilum TaxID=35806 RepID=UPI001920A2A3|nr:hypothetical protein [Rhodovulum sulfidophilum]MBL3560243.1 hypothetical protein [Rhodovulum sulfidophilum]
MSGFFALYEFTQPGIDAFERVFTGVLDETALDLSDPSLVRRIPGTRAFVPVPFETAREMAAAIQASTGSASLFELLPRTGLWAWLTFVLRDQLFRKAPDGTRKIGEVHRWYPSDPGDWQKGQRHLVRMPVLLLDQLGDNADHLLCAEPSVLPEIREQLTSQQDMFNPVFQSVARALYYDDARGRLKRGAGGKGGGSPRRLAKLRQQLDVTWDLEDLDYTRIIEKLPAEFDRFKPKQPPRPHASSGHSPDIRPQL